MRDPSGRGSCRTSPRITLGSNDNIGELRWVARDASGICRPGRQWDLLHRPPIVSSESEWLCGMAACMPTCESSAEDGGQNSWVDRRGTCRTRISCSRTPDDLRHGRMAFPSYTRPDSLLGSASRDAAKG